MLTPRLYSTNQPPVSHERVERVLLEPGVRGSHACEQINPTETVDVGTTEHRNASHDAQGGPVFMAWHGAVLFVQSQA